MFGFGVSELLVLLAILGGVGAIARRGPLAVNTPVLVLRRFELGNGDGEALHIEGRPSGFIAWLLTTIGLNTLTTLAVTNRRVTFKSASLSGEIHQVVPADRIASSHCGYSQPVWLLIMGGFVLLLGLLMAGSSRDGGSTLFGAVVIAAICGLLFIAQRKIVITIETAGGLVLGLAFKPSMIEQVAVDLPRALEAVERINAVVAAERDR